MHGWLCAPVAGRGLPWCMQAVLSRLHPETVDIPCRARPKCNPDSTYRSAYHTEGRGSLPGSCKISIVYTYRRVDGYSTTSRSRWLWSGCFPVVSAIRSPATMDRKAWRTEKKSQDWKSNEIWERVHPRAHSRSQSPTGFKSQWMMFSR